MANIIGTSLPDIITPGVNTTGGAVATSGSDTIDGKAQDDFLDGGDGDDIIHGGNGVDIVVGGNGRDNLLGENGNDLLLGGEGDDKSLDGGAGNDKLLGENGDDELNGEGDQDLLVGGLGKDTLTGGGDNDTFGYTAAAESGFPSPDAIIDFQGGATAAGDVIDLTGIDAIPATPLVNDPFTFVPVPTATAGELWYTAGILRGDTTGSGNADFAIQLVGAPLLSVTSSTGTDIFL